MYLTINNYKELTSLLEENEKVIVKVSTPTCGPCIQMSPIFQELGEESSDVYVSIEVNQDIDPDLLLYVKSKLSVSGVPAFRVLTKGEVTKTLAGAKSKEDLRTFIES